jgi:hypothetical protein
MGGIMALLAQIEKAGNLAIRPGSVRLPAFLGARTS